MAKSKMDEYGNKAIQRITMSAADTLTFQEINFAAGVFQRIALVIHRVRYFVSNTGIGLLVTSSDCIWVAVTVTNGINDLSMTHPEIVDLLWLQGYAAGTPASAQPWENGFTHDLSSMPGGGIIVPAMPIYLGMSSVSMGTALNCDVELSFTFKELADADYIELIQSRIKANV